MKATIDRISSSIENLFYAENILINFSETAQSYNIYFTIGNQIIDTSLTTEQTKALDTILLNTFISNLCSKSVN